MLWLQGHFTASEIRAEQLALVTGNADVALIELTNGKVVTSRLPIEAQAIEIQSLETGPDGNLYMGGYHRGLTIYNPNENKVELSIELFPQTEGISFCQGHVYFGTYTKAKIFRYDPQSPVDFGMSPKHNPGWIGDIGYSQDRPFSMTTGEGKVFMGMIPDYGLQGGALAVFEPKDQTWAVYPDVMKGHSILGLAYKEGLLYGGSSLWGGLGSPPAEGPAKLFIWDVALGCKVAEFALDIPEMDMPPEMIGELSIGPDGNLWGAIDGTLFVMDTTTRQIIKSKVIVPSAYAFSKWRPIFLRWGPDGLLYTTLGRRLIVVQPSTLDTITLNDIIVGNITLDHQGRLYAAQGSELYRLDLPDHLFG
ncbi:hypothetical protein D3C73_867120 [compost metagenome]